MGQGPYEVRFACISSVAGVKCTLDGVVKYSDSAGLASFYGISPGAHSYSVVAPDGWRFVSGDDVFNEPLSESGTTVIEYTPYPAIPWPSEQPWMLKFVFEAGAAADFGFTLLEANKAVYDFGESVSVAFEALNQGVGQDGATVEVFDEDTGAKLKTFSSIGDVRPGEKFIKSAAVIGSMPGRNWRLLFDVNP